MRGCFDTNAISATKKAAARNGRDLGNDNENVVENRGFVNRLLPRRTIYFASPGCRVCRWKLQPCRSRNTKWLRIDRAELTAQERADHIAEWVRLTEDKKAQDAPFSKPAKHGAGRGNEGGINAAVRELGIDRTEAQRAWR
jgi:hypothetical protein